jgi:hypothetical protein
MLHNTDNGEYIYTQKGDLISLLLSFKYRERRLNRKKVKKKKGILQDMGDGEYSYTYCSID